MLPSSKLNFAAWTGLGIIALFGGTGIYLVRNSKNLGKGKGGEEEKTLETNLEEGQEEQKVTSPEPVPAEADSSPTPHAEEPVPSNPDPFLESKPLADESDPAETDPSLIPTAEESTSQEDLPQKPSLEEQVAEEEEVPNSAPEDEEEKEVKQEREDKNSDTIHLSLDDDEDLQLPT